MLVVALILLIVAAVMFGLSAFSRVTVEGRFVSLGLLSWVLVELIRTIVKLS